MALDVLSLTAYATKPAWFGDRPLGSMWPWKDRLSPIRSVFLLEVFALVRLVSDFVLCLPSAGARCCSKQLFVGWVWVNGLVAVTFTVATAWRVEEGWTESAGAASLCCFSLTSCRLLRGAVDYARADTGPQLEVYLYERPILSERLARAIASAKSTGRRRVAACCPTLRGGVGEDAPLALSPFSRAAPGARAALARFAQRSASIRAFWRSRLKRELDRARRIARDIETAVGEYTGRSQRALDEVFNLVLRLFAHENVLEQLQAAFEREPTSVVFHSLQLSAFALFGAYPDAPRLRMLLLRMCATEIAFAHRFHWYLEAFAKAPGLRLTTEATLAVEALSADVSRAAPRNNFLETPRFYAALTDISRKLCAVERTERDQVLRDLLHDLGPSLLPSSAACVPFIGLHGQLDRRIVVRVHCHESKVFSTKARCPYLVCLEVQRRVEGSCEAKRPDDIEFINNKAACSSRDTVREPLGQWGSDQAIVSPVYGATDDCDRANEQDAATAPTPTVVFPERWSEKEDRVLGTERTSDLVPIIVKACDDLRQEQFASQLIAQAAVILEAERVPVWLRPYDVVAVGADAGVIEAIPDTVSLDALRRNDSNFVDLLDFFERYFGRSRLAAARHAFVHSLAPACILSYLLQLKDRHNGNILIDSKGHIIHIDFGYMLASSPGGNLGFEDAPFKITNDFLAVIGHDYIHRFRELCIRTFLALRRQRHRLILLAEMTVHGCEHLPCFDGRPREAIDAFQSRTVPAFYIFLTRVSSFLRLQAPISARPQRSQMSCFRPQPHRQVHQQLANVAIR